MACRGDFNEIMNYSKKKGGRPINSNSSRDTWDMVDYCELMDLGFERSKYTWLNKCFKKKNTLIYERLNRFLANREWVHQFPNS